LSGPQHHEPAPADRLNELLADLARVQAALADLAAGRPSAPDLVPLKTAAAHWRISDEAALKRAQRGAGIKKGGRWMVPRDQL
jgi:hypothetical protein